MGRRTEANRLAHKKKVDQKKNKAQETALSRKEKLKEIMKQHTSKDS